MCSHRTHQAGPTVPELAPEPMNRRATRLLAMSRSGSVREVSSDPRRTRRLALSLRVISQIDHPMQARVTIKQMMAMHHKPVFGPCS